MESPRRWGIGRRTASYERLGRRRPSEDADGGLVFYAGDGDGTEAEEEVDDDDANWRLGGGGGRRADSVALDDLGTGTRLQFEGPASGAAGGHGRRAAARPRSPSRVRCMRCWTPIVRALRACQAARLDLRCLRREQPAKPPRTVPLPAGANSGPTPAYPPNVVRNQKYSVLNFVPLVLLEQFSYFFNLYFLVVALSQLIPVLRIGALAPHVPYPAAAGS